MSMNNNIAEEFAIRSGYDRLKSAFIWYYPLNMKTSHEVVMFRVPKNASILGIENNQFGRPSIKVAIKNPLDDYNSRYFLSMYSSTSPKETDGKWIGTLTVTPHGYNEILEIYEVDLGHPLVYNSVK